MAMLSIAIMLSASAAMPSYTLPRPKPHRCANACAERYRVPASADDGYSMKDRALANDGGKCNVVGARRCASKRHTILRAPLSDD